MTTQTLGKQHAAHKVYACAEPKKGSQVVSLDLNLVSNDTSIVDFTVSEFASVIEFIQSLYIDNSLNASSVTVLMDVTNQKITIPPNSQAYIKILGSERGKFTFTSAGGVTVPVQFCNFPTDTIIWSVNSSGSGAVTASITPAAATDGSTTITLGGTAQNILGGVAPVNGFAVYNSDATNDLWISETTTAAPNGVGSIRVAANGGGYETPITRKPLGIVSIYGAVTGQKFTANKW